MRILHLADRLSDRGGADIHLRGVVAAQREAGHEVLCAVGRDEVGEGAEIVPALADVGDVGDLDPVAGRLRPDVIHVHNVMQPAVLRWAAARGAIATVQDHRAFCPGQGKWTLSGERCATTMSPEVCRACFDDGAYFDRIRGLTEARLAGLGAMRGVVVLSHYMKRELVAAGLASERVHVVPPFVVGFPRGTPGSRSGGIVLGRLVRAKGLDDAIAAWRLAGLEGQLRFVGTGTERARIERAGHDVTGWLSRAGVARALAGAAVLVMAPRWQEPFGIAGLEALACGVPVAAWRSGGIEEWHPGGAGLAAYGDVEGLAAAIRAVAGTTAAMPKGFERMALMARLEAVYGEGG